MSKRIDQGRELSGARALIKLQRRASSSLTKAFFQTRDPYVQALYSTAS